nr:hypothetical protein Iba_chr15aCG11670 [Ipomoea batatas]
MARSNHRSKRRASGHIFSPSTLVSNGAVSVTASSRSFKQWSFRRTPPSAVRVSFDCAHQWCMLNITMWLRSTPSTPIYLAHVITRLATLKNQNLRELHHPSSRPRTQTAG